MRRFLLFLLCLGLQSYSWADGVVVLNSGVMVDRLTREQVADIFLGRTNFLPNMEKIVPLEDLETTAAYRDFHANVTRKNLTQLNAHWAKMVFAGRASPPQELNAEAAKKLVETSRVYIAYIDRSQVTTKMKIIYEY